MYGRGLAVLAMLMRLGKVEVSKRASASLSDTHGIPMTPSHREALVVGRRYGQVSAALHAAR